MADPDYRAEAQNDDQGNGKYRGGPERVLREGNRSVETFDSSAGRREDQHARVDRQQGHYEQVCSNADGCIRAEILLQFGLEHRVGGRGFGKERQVEDKGYHCQGRYQETA